MSCVSQQEEHQVHQVPNLAETIANRDVPVDDIAEQFLQDLAVTLAEEARETSLPMIQATLRPFATRGSSWLLRSRAHMIFR